MRRLFILRKDILKENTGKAIAMVAHCAEAYWTNLIKRCKTICKVYTADPWQEELIGYNANIVIDKDTFEQYINGSFVKTICEAKNLNHLKKAEIIAKELGLVEGVDFGYINDNCLTVLTPENEDGTTTVGIWFKPLPDDISHQISKKYQLYK